MAFVLPNLSPSLLLTSKSPREKPIACQTQTFASQNCTYKYGSTATTDTKPTTNNTSLSASPSSQDNHHKDEFYVNLGLAVRTLREDLPLLFIKDLNYDIYRDDITFLDPLNTFTGIERYKLIFWALRFHGKILFRDISLEVLRIWQPSENVILIRWNLKGVPRVPWEAKGQFQGTSRYKLDRNGRIYEHKVDNLAFNFPPRLTQTVSVLDLVAACPASPNPTFMWGPSDANSSSWIQFYRAVRETLDQERYHLSMHDGLYTCS
ncbi:uncharacterized protein LOC126682304 [Mercurialis annua]|uniref:uncharacterized protein LOC126682304 n=1 Tax=Mercurialis annua TaxID=3986 RepID=UPI00215F79CE|nr:uncharacterized protein LOC126682304 [Mercurialis annua]XP_050233898.1 uncharacterized protein LOC126682304 [Mercurialis annua]XP_050233899.1 uncharacterized protein LOC126682304 [Mercurialis annua]